MKDDAALMSEVRKFLRSSEDAHNDWRQEARELYDMVAGHQWDEETKASMREQLRPLATFNVAGKYIDAVSGLQINNRQQPKFLPRELGDAKVNELLTGAADWARDEADAQDADSEAFTDCIVTGMGWTETFITFDENPEGMIGIERRDPLEMYWDTNARKRNLTDARCIARVRRMTKQEIEERWPEKSDEIGTDTMGVEPDETFQSLHVVDPDLTYERNAGFSNAKEGGYTVVEYQYWTRENVWKVATPSGLKTFTIAQFQKVKKWTEANGMQLNAQKVQRRKFYRAFIAGNMVLEHEDSPYQEGFTYQAITGKRDRNTNTWYGIGRALHDPQMWLNKFFSQILHIINSNAKGGLMAEVGAFEDPRQAEKTWARPDAITWLETGALSGGAPKLMPKPQAQYPQGMDRLMEFAMRALPETSGLSMELMGMADRMQPGVLEHQRKQAAITIIAWAFDAMRRYYKQHGKQLAYYIREYLSDGRLIRINGKDGQQYIPLLRDQMTMEYDVIVDEAPTSPNMKERVWAVLTEMLPTLLSAGISIPPDIIKYSPLPEELQQSWMKQMQGGPTPEQQQQQQMMMQKIATEMAKAQADAGKTQAQIAETESKTVLNFAKARETAASTGQKMAGE